MSKAERVEQLARAESLFREAHGLFSLIGEGVERVKAAAKAVKTGGAPRAAAGGDDANTADSAPAAEADADANNAAARAKALAAAKDALPNHASLTLASKHATALTRKLAQLDATLAAARSEAQIEALERENLLKQVRLAEANRNLEIEQAKVAEEEMRKSLALRAREMREKTALSNREWKERTAGGGDAAGGDASDDDDAGGDGGGGKSAKPAKPASSRKRKKVPRIKAKLSSNGRGDGDEGGDGDGDEGGGDEGGGDEGGDGGTTANGSSTTKLKFVVKSEPNGDAEADDEPVDPLAGIAAFDPGSDGEASGGAGTGGAGVIHDEDEDEDDTNADKNEANGTAADDAGAEDQPSKKRRMIVDDEDED
jgi:hypothetical protein